jgi:hypothetical protein
VSRYRAGYDSRPDIVAPTVSQGAAQRLASGTTSAAVTVGAATGGGGTYTYSSPAIDRPGGSSAAVSGTVPGALSVTGLADGESVVVSGTATDGTGQAVAWSHVVAVAAAGGGGGGGASWVEKLSLNLKGATTSGPHTSGDTTVDATGGDVEMTSKRAGNSGNVTVTQNTGVIVNAAGGSGAMTAFFDLKAALTGYDYAYLRYYVVAVDVFITAIDFDDNGSICNISLSDSKSSWNDGDARGLEVYRDSADLESRRIRGASGTTVIGSQRSKVTERVVTLLMTRGQIVDMVDTAGTSAPADPRASTIYTCGGDAIGRNSDDPLMLANLFLNVSAFGAAALTVTDIKVRRLE